MTIIIIRNTLKLATPPNALYQLLEQVLSFRQSSDPKNVQCDRVHGSCMNQRQHIQE